MNAPNTSLKETLPPDAAQRVDQACSRFEAAWRQGQRPHLEDYLGDMAGQERLVLLRELILLDIDYRRWQGEEPRGEEYLSRFPELDREWLDRALAAPPAPQVKLASPAKPLADRDAKIRHDESGSTEGLPDRRETASSMDDRAADAGSTDGAPEVLDFLGKPEAEDEIGRLAHYRVLKELGRGGMGCVLLAEDTKLQRSVALKVMLPRFARDATAKERFLREARAAAKVRHDNVITIFQVDEWNGVPFIALEFLQGTPLDRHLTDKGALPLPAALRIALEIAEGLSAAHRQRLVHRDIKPGNVWLEALGEPGGSGDRFRVKILDFGLARPEKDDTHLTQSGAIVGTPAFMAPEQARGEKVDGRSDLFSLGVVLYRLTTGKQPFAGLTTAAVLTAIAVDNPPPPRSVNPNIRDSLDKVIMKLLEKDPARRYGSAQEVVAALDGVLKELTHAPNADEPTAVVAPVNAGDPEETTRGRSPTGRGPDARTSRRGPKVLFALALGFFAVSILAWQVVVHLQNKNDKKVGEIPLVPKKGAAKGSPFDRLRREDIPPEKLKAAGHGDPAKAPPEVVAILGTSMSKPNPNAEVRFDVQPSGNLVAVSYTREDRVAFWDVEQGTERPFAEKLKSQTLKFSRDGKLLAVSEWTGTTRLWDVGTAKPVLDLTESRFYLPHLHFLQGDRGLIVSRNDGIKRLTLFSVPGRQPLAAGPVDIEIEGDFLLASAVSPDGSQLVTSVRRREEGKPVRAVKVWELPSGKFSHVLLPNLLPSEQLDSLAFNNDGTRLFATSLYTRSVFCLEFPSGKVVGQYRGHESKTSSVALSPDGRLGASLDQDSTVRLWDPETLQEKRVLRLNPPHADVTISGPHEFQFTPEGRHLVVQNRDGTIYVVRLPAD